MNKMIGVGAGFVFKLWLHISSLSSHEIHLYL